MTDTPAVNDIPAILARAKSRDLIESGRNMRNFIQEVVPNMAAEILSLRAQLAETQSGLSWALDIIDMNDERLLELGDPVNLVLSSVHLAGKAKARATLDADLTRREK